MFCKKCGTKIPENSKFCPSCGDAQEVAAKPVVNTQQPVAKDNNKLANTLSTISVCLYFGSPLVAFILYCCVYGATGLDESTLEAGGVLSSVVSLLSMGCTLTAYILMIIARVKCPTNTFAKVLMWVYIALFALGVVLFIIAFVACAGMFAACSGMGMIVW